MTTNTNNDYRDGESGDDLTVGSQNITNHLPSTNHPQGFAQIPNQT